MAPNEPDEEEVVIICLNQSSDLIPVEGSTPTNCTECDEKLWIAPSSAAIFRDEPNAKPICIDCALKKDVGEFKSTPEQIEEFRKELKARYGI